MGEMAEWYPEGWEEGLVPSPYLGYIWSDPEESCDECGGPLVVIDPEEGSMLVDPYCPECDQD